MHVLLSAFLRCKQTVRAQDSRRQREQPEKASFSSQARKLLYRDGVQNYVQHN